MNKKDKENDINDKDRDIMDKDNSIKIEYNDKQKENNSDSGKNHRKLKKILLTIGTFLLVIFMTVSWLVFTDSGNHLVYRIASALIYRGLDRDEETQSAIVPMEDQPYEDNDYEGNTINAAAAENHQSENQNTEEITNEESEPAAVPRSEDYVSNYLLFGVEEIDNARNTDAILIASINKKDCTIKLASLMRDTYIVDEDNKPHKLNSFFSRGGADRLVEIVEDNYRIKIDGYAYINFESFEKIVDLLGGISIELGEGEANYLNHTNYISNPQYRNVHAGINHLNGNQTLGYCRIRMVKTLGGATDDYGRTLRHRRVLSAIFNEYKSKGLIDLIVISKNIFKYIKTNLTQDQIEKILTDVVENKISDIETMRIPVNGAFEDPKEYNGVKYPIIVDWDANIEELYKFIFLDSEEEAQENLEKYK